MLNPYKDINFVKRNPKIFNDKNKCIFDEIVEFPDYFSDNAVKVVSSKYLCNSAKKKETSLREMIDRVSDTITQWGKKNNYFENEKEAEEFNYKLKYYQIHQCIAFNSPVYFNIGLQEKPQTSACFILSIEDNMESISDSLKTETFIFKNGSGSGKNYSKIRSSRERVKGAGCASGPVQFIKVEDISGGVIKSGGIVRRVAKMGILNADHPDIFKFIECKLKEEEKINILRNNKFIPNNNESISDNVFFQNINLSIMLNSELMTIFEKCYIDKEENIENDYFYTKYILTKENCEKYKVKDLLYKIAEVNSKIGDPNVMFYENINKYNTCKNDGNIESSNPCGEFLFLNNSACNLAAYNIKKVFKIKDDKLIFNYELFADIIYTLITAQDILIDNSSFPTKEIEKNSKEYRPLGLGFSNVGSFFMSIGLPYGSDFSCNLMSGLTSLTTALAYEKSTELAKRLGEFKHFERNKDSFYEVLNYHKDDTNKEMHNFNYTSDFDENLYINSTISEIYSLADKKWEYLINKNNNLKFRNAQTTLCMPTGTTSFLMDCSTTGIEPVDFLIKKKLCSDGSVLTIINKDIEEALVNLKYEKNKIDKILKYIEINGNVDECDDLEECHKDIFLPTYLSGNGKYNISYTSHLDMMFAIQPFISGAISKTIGLDKDSTVEDIVNIYYLAWKRGLKGVTTYIDGSKIYQPHNSNKKVIKEEKNKLNFNKSIIRKKLPKDKKADIHSFTIGGLSCDLSTAYYEDGELGEMWMRMGQDGTTINGLLNALSLCISIGIQYTDGKILNDLCDKMIGRKFEPYGITDDPDIRFTNSIVDYAFRFIKNNFLQENNNLIENENKENYSEVEQTNNIKFNNAQICTNCGGMMFKKGRCFYCNNCGNNNGACE